MRSNSQDKGGCVEDRATLNLTTTKDSTPQTARVSEQATPLGNVAALSFVDTLTIDYKKTLSEYRNKLLESARRSTLSHNFQSLTTKHHPEENLSLEECLKGDPFQHVHHQKNKERAKNQELIRRQLSSGGSMSHREMEKAKLVQRAEEACDKADFVSVLTKDPIYQAYLSRQSQA